MAEDKVQPIIIKKIKKGGGGHHGGAWKVAYADFVTAMMAFFLLLWLLNVTTDEQKLGIAQYFDPVSVSKSVSGSGGVLGGQTMVKDGAMISVNSPIGVDMGIPGVPETGPGEEREDMDDAGARTGQYVTPDEAIDLITRDGDVRFSDNALDQANMEREQREFDEAAELIRQAIQDTPDLADLAQHLIIDQTPEGLRIQIVDQEGRSMFPLGSARMYDETNTLLELVARAVADLPNKVSVSGHTDSAQFRAGATYNNWDLSADRANAARRALIAAGLAEARISHVSGRADRDHLLPDEPMNARNRRISITLLREHQLRETGGATEQGSGRSGGRGTAPAQPTTPMPAERSSPIPIPRGGSR